ncbi:Mn superoxide dismutase SodB [Ascodesmis nigricans]|uniref:Superoxide dismutase n=1 Tax=Ascodesmis nigricans TaxID=341454 RepID=A0A4S2MKG8_9PEZI|nr:Mn superoxide dismutase SodB [Ascodesmis nigricans]
MSILARAIRPTTTRIAGTTMTKGVAAQATHRGKHTLPDLKYDYSELEPVVDARIMELHHSKHHQTYVNSLNDAEAKYAEALHKNDVASQIALQAALKFHGGGHLNHTLFWENLAPKSQGGGSPPTGKLATDIDATFGGFDAFKKTFNTALAGIQGSGWSWLVKNKETGGLEIISLPNQDPVVGKYTPIVGIDAWEHAYYLQYENRKAEYFAAIWDVVNWKTAEKRYGA